MSSENKKDSEPNSEKSAGGSFAFAATGNAARDLFSSPGVKFILIGVITVALLIPAMMVWSLVEDRSRRADQVAQSISQGWGGEQALNGPYLVVPYSISESVNNNTITRQVTRHALISAESLLIDGTIDVEERRKSIYKTQLYHLKTKLSGRFSKVDLEKVLARGGRPQLQNAFMVLGVSDMTGFRSDVEATINDTAKRKFIPGLNQLRNGQVSKNSRKMRSISSGVYIPLGESDIKDGFDFTIELALNGSRNLSVVPAGGTTEFNLKSNWPHPGFDGRFLPEQRDINAEGFTANWTIPNLARGIDTVLLSETLPSVASAMQVNFVEPLKFYQVTSRTLKYSIAFFSLIFLGVFILELTGKKVLHWIQYLLVGFAMVIFYVLLLAFAEQIGFTYAYLISSAATTGLIAWYIGDAMGHKRGTLVMTALLGTTYLVMYLILNEEDYALLAGSVVAFAAIAGTMVTTRKVNWNGSEKAA